MLVCKGEGLINSIINKLPFELHIPGYEYCGPGTKLKERLEKGQKGINPLDQGCRLHDIEYSKHKDLEGRHRADKALQKVAWQRVKADDSSFGEKAAALAVTGIMGAKRKLGMGVVVKKQQKKAAVNKRKKCTQVAGKALSKNNKNQLQRHSRSRRQQRGGKKISFRGGFLNKITKEFKKQAHQQHQNSGNAKELVKNAIIAARRIMKSVGGKRKIRVPRVIPVPNVAATAAGTKQGGIIPLIPIFAGLSALGAIAGGTSAIAKTINDAKAAQENIKENQRHNRSMEALAASSSSSSKKGGGALFLKPYRKGGSALYLKPYNKSSSLSKN